MFKRFCRLLPDCLPVMLLALILIISVFYGWRAVLFWNAAVFSVVMCFAGIVFLHLSRVGENRRYSGLRAIGFFYLLTGGILPGAVTGLPENVYLFTIQALSGFCAIWFCSRLYNRMVQPGAEA
ncbi:TPA: hypothetical protein ACNEZX_002491 [Escherichia coli]